MELASTPGVALKQKFWSWRCFARWRISTLVDDIVSPAQSEDGLGTAFLRAARAKEEEFNPMRHERRSDIKLPSHNQGSKKACLSGAEV